MAAGAGVGQHTCKRRDLIMGDVLPSFETRARRAESCDAVLDSICATLGLVAVVKRNLARCNAVLIGANASQQRPLARCCSRSRQRQCERLRASMRRHGTLRSCWSR